MYGLQERIRTRAVRVSVFLCALGTVMYSGYHLLITCTQELSVVGLPDFVMTHAYTSEDN